MHLQPKFRLTFKNKWPLIDSVRTEQRPQRAELKFEEAENLVSGAIGKFQFYPNWFELLIAALQIIKTYFITRTGRSLRLAFSHNPKGLLLHSPSYGVDVPRGSWITARLGLFYRSGMEESWLAASPRSAMNHWGNCVVQPSCLPPPVH